MRQQQSADDRAECDPGPACRPPEADRALPLVRLGEGVGDDRQRGGHDQRGSDAHARTGRDERPDRAGKRGPGRAGRECNQAGEERALAADSVGEAARHEHQPGEQHDVGIDDPLQIARAGVQLAHERRQGDVEDGAVERDDQQRHAQHGQREPVSRRNGLPLAVLDPSRPFVE